MHGTEATPTRVETAAELNALIATTDRLLVELFTEGCGACAAMEPILGVVAKETGVPVVLVNPRDDPALVERFDVRSVPTLVSFEDGERAGRLADGFVRAERVIEFLR